MNSLENVRWIHLNHRIEEREFVKVDCPGVVNLISPYAIDFIAELTLLLRVGCEFEKYPAQGGDCSLVARSHKRACNCQST